MQCAKVQVQWITVRKAFARAGVWNAQMHHQLAGDHVLAAESAPCLHVAYEDVQLK